MIKLSKEEYEAEQVYIFTKLGYIAREEFILTAMELEKRSPVAGLYLRFLIVNVAPLRWDMKLYNVV